MLLPTVYCVLLVTASVLGYPHFDEDSKESIDEKTNSTERSYDSDEAKLTNLKLLEEIIRLANIEKSRIPSIQYHVDVADDDDDIVDNDDDMADNDDGMADDDDDIVDNDDGMADNDDDMADNDDDVADNNDYMVDNDDGLDDYGDTDDKSDDTDDDDIDVADSDDLTAGNYDDLDDNDDDMANYHDYTADNIGTLNDNIGENTENDEDKDDNYNGMTSIDDEITDGKDADSKLYYTPKEQREKRSIPSIVFKLLRTARLIDRHTDRQVFMKAGGHKKAIEDFRHLFPAHVQTNKYYYRGDLAGKDVTLELYGREPTLTIESAVTASDGTIKTVIRKIIYVD